MRSATLSRNGVIVFYSIVLNADRIPYVDMPNHSQTSDSSLMVTNAEVEIKPVEESFDNLEPFLYVLKVSNPSGSDLASTDATRSDFSFCVE